jgi:hypothetical protein
MTAGQQLIEQGRQKDAQGILLSMLRQRFDPKVDARTEQRIAAASLDQLERCSHMFSAATLAELFRGLE